MLGNAEAGEPGVDEDLVDVFGVFVVIVDLSGARRDAFPGDAADGRLEIRELGREVEIHERRSLRRPLFPDRSTPGSWAKEVYADLRR